jgi:hypothetical protein
VTSSPIAALPVAQQTVLLAVHRMQRKRLRAASEIPTLSVNLTIRSAPRVAPASNAADKESCHAIGVATLVSTLDTACVMSVAGNFNPPVIAAAIRGWVWQTVSVGVAVSEDRFLAISRAPLVGASRSVHTHERSGKACVTSAAVMDSLRATAGVTWD